MAHEKSTGESSNCPYEKKTWYLVVHHIFRHPLMLPPNRSKVAFGLEKVGMANGCLTYGKLYLALK